MQARRAKLASAILELALSKPNVQMHTWYLAHELDRSAHAIQQAMKLLYESDCARFAVINRKVKHKFGWQFRRSADEPWPSVMRPMKEPPPTSCLLLDTRMMARQHGRKFTLLSRAEIRELQRGDVVGLYDGYQLFPVKIESRQGKKRFIGRSILSCSPKRRLEGQRIIFHARNIVCRDWSDVFLNKEQP